MDFKMQFKLPDGVAGDHCLLRWNYATGNSCNMAGYKKCTNYPHPRSRPTNAASKRSAPTL